MCEPGTLLDMSSSSLSPSQVPVGVDPDRPSIARVYDGFLGGKHHYEVDREVIARITEACPEAVDIARQNRAFLNRACRYLATQTDLEQYIDCGAGLPTAENTHQIVQRVNPHSTVVYVDNDPVVLAHGRAILEETEQVHMVDADLFEPATVLEHPQVRDAIDFTQPAALLHCFTLHHLESDNGPELMREYIDALAPGSYVVLSHLFNPEIPELTDVAERIENVVLSTLGAGRFRTRAELEALLPGTEIVQPNAVTAPSVVVCDDWWPDGPRQKSLSDAGQCVAGIVARKP